MPESALLVGSSNGSTSLIRACLAEFHLATVLGEPEQVFSARDLKRHALLVCELPLEGCSAAELVRAVKPASPNLPVVFIGGSGTEDTAQADEWVCPPLEREPLVRAITGALLKREMALHASGQRRPERDVLAGVAEGLTRTLEAADKLSDGHAHSVASLAGKLADAHGLIGQEARTARLAGVLHDLGKVGVRQSVLDKPGALSSAEWQEVQRHPETGAAILGRVEAFAEVAVYVRYHHERHDGSGYPAGLRGSEIPLVSKIVAVADAYDAMVTPRCYRSCGSVAYAAREFRAHAGRQWDPGVVQGLFACVPELCA